MFFINENIQDETSSQGEEYDEIDFLLRFLHFLAFPLIFYATFQDLYNLEAGESF